MKRAGAELQKGQFLQIKAKRQRVQMHPLHPCSGAPVLTY